MLERSLVQNMKLEMKAEDALRFLGRRGAKLNMDEIIAIVNKTANPKYLIKEVACSVNGDEVRVADCVFQSAELAEAVKGKTSVLVFAGTAGGEILECAAIENEGIRTILTSAMFVSSLNALRSYLSASFGGDWTVLKPGVVAEWPVSANIALCGILGGVEEIGITLNDAGYMKPIDSNAGLLISA